MNCFVTKKGQSETVKQCGPTEDNAPSSFKTKKRVIVILNINIKEHANATDLKIKVCLHMTQIQIL